MKHFRIIETGSDFPDVLLHRDRDEDGKEMVNILAIGIIGNDENMFASEEIVCKDYQTACSFIADFSKKSAEDWCKKHGVEYW